MAVDLKHSSLLQRFSILLDGDQLLMLEHGITSDRIRRVPLTRVQSLTIDKRQNVLLLVVLTLAGLAFLPLLFVELAGFVIFGVICLLVIAVFFIWKVVCGVTIFTFTYDGQTRSCKASASPTKISMFADRLIDRIEQVQARDREARGAEGMVTEMPG